MAVCRVSGKLSGGCLKGVWRISMGCSDMEKCADAQTLPAEIFEKCRNFHNNSSYLWIF